MYPGDDVRPIPLLGIVLQALYLLDSSHNNLRHHPISDELTSWDDSHDERHALTRVQDKARLTCLQARD